jgi:hypothetical protein
LSKQQVAVQYKAMNTTEEFSNLQNPSEDFRSMQKSSEDFRSVQTASERAGGIGRGKKYPGAETPEHEFDRDDFIIMEEAYMLFEEEGERRSVRMIAEYCKNGELVCFYDSDDKRWHITQASVENKIGKIKALNARKTATGAQSTSEQPSEPIAASQHAAPDRPQQRESPHESSDAIKKLEQENLDLKIVNRGKDYFIEQLQRERESFITRIENNSRLIGELETKLLQLDAPRPKPEIDRSSYAPWREADHNPSGGGMSPPTSDTHQGAPLSESDNVNNNYEHSSQYSFPEDHK